MSEMNLCVQRKMKILSEEDSPLSLKQRLGKAFGSCKQKTKSDMIHDFAKEIRHDITPMELIDAETGIGIQGVSGNFPIGQLVPVVSTDVKGIGTLGSEVFAQFHNTSGTYRYNLGSPENALQVFEQFLSAPSKGKWLWANFRGHSKGEKVTANKIGPSFFRGIPTIGGTSASLEPYSIVGRSPIPKVGGFKSFEQVAAQLVKFKTDPEKLLGKPITQFSPSAAKKIAKIGGFKSVIQLKQGIKELKAREHLKSLQPGNIIKGVI